MLDNKQLTDQERRIIAAIAQRSPFAADLIGQVERASVTGREWTGVGFYVNLAVSDGTPDLPPADPVCYGTSGLMAGQTCWFTLWLTDDRRRVQFLEIANCEGTLPQDARVEELDGNPPAC